MFSKYLEVKKLFKNAPNNQNVILAEAISLYAVNIENLKLLHPALEEVLKDKASLELLDFLHNLDSESSSE